jgi:hypothetical protein
MQNFRVISNFLLAISLMFHLKILIEFGMCGVLNDNLKGRNAVAVVISCMALNVDAPNHLQNISLISYYFLRI